MDKLDSHILKSDRYVLLPNKHNHKIKALDVLTYEALSAVNSTQAIRAFAEDVYSGTTGSCHFENKAVADFWNLYDSFAPDFKFYHKFAETQERRRFARRPLYIAVINGAVVGGLWVDAVRGDKRGKHASFHIFTAKEYRKNGIAEASLDSFEADAKRKYDFINCSWGPRDDCSPAKLFEKRGYAVATTDSGSGSAIKSLKSAVLEYELLRTF